MKQKALCRFSKSALKGNYIKILAPGIIQAAIFVLRIFLEFLGAYFLCRYFYFYEAVLTWCALRLVLRAAQVLLCVKSRCTLIRRCIINISLPCGYDRSIRKKLRRVYFLRSIARFILNVLFTGTLIFGVWCIGTNSFINDSVYKLMAAFQAVPLMAVLLCIRIRFSLCFACAEVMCAVNPDESAFKSFFKSYKMLSGTWGFVAALFARNILRIFSPVFMQTIITYFAVRHIEWQYQEQEDNERTYFYGKHQRAYEA